MKIRLTRLRNLAKIRLIFDMLLVPVWRITLRFVFLNLYGK